MKTKEKIARNSASKWCGCFKCEGKVNATGCVCKEGMGLTCALWYHCYRTALLALEDDRVKIKDE